MNVQRLCTRLKARIPWRNKERAQSVTEFAILGSLVIIAFAFLINYSEKLNREQYYIQQTFRAALQEAKNANNSASYTRVVFNRMPNVSNPMELGQLQSFSSSANVLWADGKSRNEDGSPKPGVSKYRLNEAAAIDIPVRAEAPSPGTTETGSNVFSNTVDTITTLVKSEAPGGKITTSKTLTAKDILQASVSIDNTPYTFTQTLGEKGKYYPGDHTLSRSRSMQ